MKKLTAEKCREMIHDMNVKRDFNGLSIREDRYLEALEIALPVLEQQESKRQVTLREAVSEIRKLTKESGGYDFEALRTEQDNSDWISCSDRMPTNGKAVIVCSHQGTVQDMNYFWAYGKWWPVTEDEDSAPEGEFSHWQPIPAPPQQPTTDTYRQIDNDGWVEWGGGECPVSAVEVVEYRTVFGNVCKNVAAMTRWEHLGLMGDIIAYRVVEQERERGEEV